MLFKDQVVIAVVAQNGIDTAIDRNFVDIFETKTFLGVLETLSKKITS